MVTPLDTLDRLEQWRGMPRSVRDKMNRLTNLVNRLAQGIDPPNQKLTAPVPPGSANPIIVKQFQVITVRTDYVECKELNGITASGNFKIALPFLLRKTPFDGKIRNGITYAYTTLIQRTATQGADVETQVIVPSYVVGDSIYATINVAGFSDVESVVNGVPVRIEYLDLNIDGRAWAREAA